MKFLALFLLCWIVISSAAVDKRLQFNEQGKFKVVQFTDLHYGNNQYENDQTAAVQDAILAAEQPDLVIITGDLISGYEWDGIEAGWFEKLWRKLVAPMKKHNTRWAVALGNHDVEGDLNGRAIVELESTEELSLTQQGPSDISGATNYYLPIYRYNSTDIGHILWVFDSGNKGCLGISGWGCVEYSQVSWYRNASRTLATQEKNGRVIPALAFFHIPLYEHLDLWNVRGVQGDLAEGEGVCCSSVNTGLYAAMKEIGDIKGVYCGHDHNNDYIGDYHGITLGFGRKTGYGCYGPPWGWQHGARVLEIIDSTAGANTWLRLEDGSVEIQKQNPVSMRKFLGCCSMEGHGRVAMGWLGILVSILATAATIALIAVFVVAVVRACRKQKGKSYDSVPNEGEGDDGCDGAGLVSRYPVRVNAPVPRQRRSIGQEVA